MANLPNEEGLNPQSDVTLPLIEDLPFDSDINFEEADLKFMEDYGDLFDSVEVEDMGLQTLIQIADEKDFNVNNQTNSLLEPEPLLAQTNESEVKDNNLVWLEEDENNQEVDDYLDWQAQTQDDVDSTLDLSWEEPIVDEAVEEIEEKSIFSEVTEEPIVDQTTVQVEEELIFDEAVEEIEEELIFGEVTEEPIVNEVVEEVWEEEPIVDQTTVQVEEELIFDEVAEEPIVNEVVEEIEEESILSEVIEKPIVDDVTEELIFSEFEEESKVTEEPIVNGEIQQDQNVDSLMDELETLLQIEEEPEQQEPIELPTIDELETLLQYDQEQEEPEQQEPIELPTIDELETLLQAEEELEQQEPIESPTIDELETLLQNDQEQEEDQPEFDNQIDQLETLLQVDEDYTEEETNLPEDPPVQQELRIIQQEEENYSSDPAVDELITLLQDEDSSVENVESEEQAMIDWEAEEEQPYSSELASMWDTPEEGVDGLLEGIEEKTIGLESQYEWEAPEQVEDEQISNEEQYEYYDEQSEDHYESDPNYEEDEDSSIDQIMTAFQKNDEGVEDEIYEESENEYEYQDEYEQNYEAITEEEEVGTMDNNFEQQVDWEASYNEYQESEEDDYDEWQQGLSSNEFEVEIDDEESAIDEIITTFQFGQDNPSTQVVLDEEADAMVTKWQQTEKEKEEDYSLSDSGMIDWEKVASGGSSSLDIPQPDFESFTIGHDPMETAIRAKNVLEKSKSSLKESINFKMEDEDMSLPPLPPIRQTKTEVKPSPSIGLPNFADEFYEEERYQPRSKTPQTSGKQKDGIFLEDDSDLPYRSQLQSKGKKNFNDVDDDDWEDLLEDIPPVPEELFGVSEQTAARYANSGAPSQFTDSFQSGDTQPANLHHGNSFPSQSVSQTAPTFPETPPTSVRVQQFFENNGRAILQITMKIGLVVIPIGLLWFIFSIPRVNKETTLTGLRLGIWKDMRGKNLRSVVLKGKNLSGVNFSGADLSGADLSEVNLRGAKLNGAKLEKTNLIGAKLNLADFTDANLKGANLSRSEVSKTIFRGADLSSAKLSNRSWAKDNPPITDNKTKCPNGRTGPCRL